ncbi:flagellar biosynthesis regulator FlaF [Roseicyclus sp.]|uniref:flagellar biosynthesis regulator FlaF n=1 Tax=Roseicyclus sp. TaxID=1914329 RepID=UPI003F6BEAE2
MTATQLAHSAYAAASAPVRTSRGSEHAIFERVTARLKRATDPNADIAHRAAALHENRQLWITLATDIAGPENALPQSLRAQLFYLAEFSLLQSATALRDPTAIEALIDINKAVMRGLDGVADPA